MTVDDETQDPKPRKRDSAGCLLDGCLGIGCLFDLFGLAVAGASVTLAATLRRLASRA